MANLYWVGGTGDWSDTDHWATTSGGSGGASVPTSSDNVFIDANSGFGSGGEITANWFFDYECKNFSSQSGHSYTIASDLLVYGSLLLESGMTCGSFSVGGTGTKTITTNGASTSGLYFNQLGVGDSTITILDEVTTGNMSIAGSGTVDFNDNDINLTGGIIVYSSATLYLGSGTLSIIRSPYNFPVTAATFGGTIYPETSLIKVISDRDYGTYLTVSESGTNLNNVWLSGAYPFYIKGQLTANEIKSEPGSSVFFVPGRTTTSDLNMTGEDENLIVLDVGNQFEYNAGLYSTSYIVVQPFIPESTHTVTDIKILVRKQGSPGDISVNVYAVDEDNLPTGSSLASGSISASSVGSTDAYHTASLGAGTSLTADTTYCFTLTTSSADGSNNYVIKMDTNYYFDTDLQNALSTDSGSSYSKSNNVLAFAEIASGTTHTTSIFDQFTLSKASGTVDCEYLDISNSNVTGGATWIAKHSTNTTNNTGWIFGDPVFPTVSTLLLTDGTDTFALGVNDTVGELTLTSIESTVEATMDGLAHFDTVSRLLLVDKDQTVSSPQSWGVVNRGHSGWVEPANSTTTWSQTISNSTPWQ